MRRTISSSLTFLYKVIFPVLWISFFVVVPVVIVVNGIQWAPDGLVRDQQILFFANGASPAEPSSSGSA
jgi:hypothetical protein